MCRFCNICLHPLLSFRHRRWHDGCLCDFVMWLVTLSCHAQLFSSRLLRPFFEVFDQDVSGLPLGLLLSLAYGFWQSHSGVASQLLCRCLVKDVSAKERIALLAQERIGLFHTGHTWSGKVFCDTHRSCCSGGSCCCSPSKVASSLQLDRYRRCNQARSQVLRFGGAKYMFRGARFLFSLHF